MNWFERYGIVGAYFCIIMLINLHLNQRLSLCYQDNSLLTALFVASVLPAGYILSIFSQWLYYKGFNGIQVHREIVKVLSEECKKNLDISENETEAVLEAKITTACRILPDTEKLKYLGIFATKRWDVLALNSAVYLVNMIYWFSILIIKLLKFKPFSFKETMLLLLSISVSFISSRSCKVLTEQIIIVNKKMCEGFKKNSA